ncbi:glycoside hydrolase family 28 protein [uncultured Polaribacter sp.]|uniref:glycoside hydrolase family 28 protein n=1 Tax=uncultured Polaribacter sp. TaxID=174711 RepID=UPI0030DD70FB|tara:strand:- start:1050 stop:2501 length:1452 start_codon:yes stop_codon:yes gene_type:complete
MIKKRVFTQFKNSNYIIVLSFLLLASCQKKIISDGKTQSSVWHKMNEITALVKEPVFLNRDFNVLDFGGKADGVFNNAEAFKKAISACAKNGGGRVLVPKGKYLTGAIHLENNVNFHVSEGAEILFSTNPKDYYPLVATSFEGIELMNYSPLIYANNKTNVAVTGKGVLNGQASNKNWWAWCGKDTYGWKKGTPMQKDSLNLPRLMQMGDDGTLLKDRIFGDNHYLRPNFIEFYECNNALLKDVKIVNAPFWIIHPFKSTNVIVDGVTVESHGPNNDGCDPEYSKNVIIKNCTFNTGDDCIAIKAGRDADGRRVAIKTENIVVQNCKMIDGHGGVVIGSEMSAGVSNVFVENCTMDSPELDRAIRIKTNSRRGGTVDGVYVRNLKIGQVKEAVLKVNMHYATYANQTGNFIPKIKNILLENVKVKNGGSFGILANGYEESPIENITFINVKIDKVKEAFSLKHVKNLKLIDTYINGSLMQSPD